MGTLKNVDPRKKDYYLNAEFPKKGSTLLQTLPGAGDDTHNQSTVLDSEEGEWELPADRLEARSNPQQGVSDSAD